MNTGAFNEKKFVLQFFLCIVFAFFVSRLLQVTFFGYFVIPKIGTVDIMWCKYDGPANNGHCYYGLQVFCHTIFRTLSKERPAPYMPFATGPYCQDGFPGFR